jgi:prevent-host-death family protein
MDREEPNLIPTLADIGAAADRSPASSCERPSLPIKDDFSRFLREAGKGDIVITRHGKPAGVLIGFQSEDDWFDYRLENDPRFLDRIEKARQSIRVGQGMGWRI